jgi:hypothetical protein
MQCKKIKDNDFIFIKFEKLFEELHSSHFSKVGRTCLIPFHFLLPFSSFRNFHFFSIFLEIKYLTSNGAKIVLSIVSREKF